MEKNDELKLRRKILNWPQV